MKVLSVAIIECALLYGVAIGTASLNVENEAAATTRRAEQASAAAKGELERAECENRGVDEARRRDIEAALRAFEAEGAAARCAESDWVYRAFVMW
ncbi:MAG TPA: hypothetical protein VGG44_12405 [Tepidisphaeraceae bacterium]|jgi:hypothetical protein